MNKDDKNMEDMNFENEEERETYEFVRELGLKIEKAKADFKGDYILNKKNYERFLEVLEYFKKFAKEQDGNIVELETNPEEVSGGIIIEVPIVDLVESDLNNFANILKKVDVFGINPSASGSVLVDITVNNIWNMVQR